MTQTTYTVSGMACGHCANFVTDAIKTLPGVTRVDVDVEDGSIAVTSEEGLDIADVRTALEDTGYELTGVRSPEATEADEWTCKASATRMRGSR